MDIFNGTEPRGPSDFDLIEEIITEDGGERLRALLPGPPAPPADLCQPQNHRLLRQSSSPPSQPVLVARGTACQPTCTFPQPPSCPSREMAHPSRSFASSSSRRGRGSSCSLASKSSSGVSSQNRGGDSEMLERLLNKPKLVVVEEPKERGMRFRYECEGRSAGSIPGASSTETNKSQPAIEIQGPIKHLKRVTVTVSLVTKDPPHRPHPTALWVKTARMDQESAWSRSTLTATDVTVCAEERAGRFTSEEKKPKYRPFQTGHTKGIEDMDMNVVRLGFQCEFEWDDGGKECLSPVLSNPIYDKKATTTSQLKIGHLNQYRGSCAGKTEIYMLCDKVQKDDIEIIFRRGSWKACGEFAQTDVHRQIAIVFKTPPYQEQDLTEEVEVSVVLRRPTDQMESESITFTYLPHNPDPYEVKRKRKIKSDISFREKSCGTADGAPAAEQPFHFPQPQTMMPPEDRLCAPQPGTFALEEMQYSEPQDSNTDTDTTTIINQILEIPELREMLSDPSFNMSLSSGFEQGPMQTSRLQTWILTQTRTLAHTLRTFPITATCSSTCSSMRARLRRQRPRTAPPTWF
ncbi:hypothetical protein F7725_020708, partial [Dissostichus mawsoni]